MKHFETAMLAFGLLLVALPVARAADTTCPPTPSGSTVNGNLIVPANASCNLTTTLTVTGNVVVGTGASLGIFPVDGQTVTINGNITADHCNSVGIQTFGNGMFSVGGNVNIRNCTGPVNGYSGIIVTIDGNFLCASSGVCVAGGGVVHGNLTMDNNNAVSEVDDNQIGGNVDVSGNSGSAPTVLGNRIGGNLQCFDNNPPPINFGFPNSVGGNELETTGRRRANGRSRRSPLIDRRHAKVWISMSQPPLTQPRSRPREQFGPSCDTSSMSAFVIWAATPWEGRGAATAKPRIISAYSSTCSDMASASSTSMPR